MMKDQTLVVFIFALLFVSTSAQLQCGKALGNRVCPGGKCCSQHGYCGDTSAYCGFGCQSQCGGAKASMPDGATQQEATANNNGGVKSSQPDNATPKKESTAKNGGA